jgi:hypothetical protein
MAKPRKPTITAPRNEAERRQAADELDRWRSEILEARPAELDTTDCKELGRMIMQGLREIRDSS